MSTNITTIDLRNMSFYFDDISEGTMFTHDDCYIPYIKMPIFCVLNEKEIDTVDLSRVDDKFNAINLRGEIHWFDYDCRVHPIERISVTMK